MKHLPRQISILTLGVMLAIASCGKEPKRVAASTNAPKGSVDKLKEQARNAVTTSKEFITQQKDRWQRSYSDRLSKFDKQLANLKAKSSAVGDEAKSDWNKALAQLEQKKNSAAQKLEQFKTAGTDKWQELKTNTETAFAELEKSFKDTLSSLTHDDKPSKP